MARRSNDASSTFFAYGALPHLRAETVQQAARVIAKRGHIAKTWEDLEVKGTLLIDTICRAIDESEIVVAEVSDLNSNVLFEAGYALATNKHLWLALDETDVDAVRRWKELGIFATIGRVDYSGNSEKLVTACTGPAAPANGPDLLETLMSGGRARQADAVFAPALPTRFQAALTLESFLERQSHLTILGAGDDLGMAPLDFYVKEIYRASAAVFHLLAPKRLRAAEHNARASFFAGLAHGFGLPVLMVVEEGFTSPLDYKDLLYTYDSAAALQEHVRQWLDSLPKQAGTNKRLGKLALDIELPLRSFGQYVAEYERDELTDYFVETGEFRSILAGDSKVFVGRKGTGKTATMSQGVLELRKDRRNLVVSVKPSAYELAGLVEFVRALQSDSQSEYAMLSIWAYLLHTEIAVRTVSYASERPAGGGTDDALGLLTQELNDLQIDLDADLSERLEKAVSTLTSESRRTGETAHAHIGRVLNLHRLSHLKELVLRTLKDFNRVAVLIDNLDKTWEKGADYGVMARFILSLLTAIGRVEKDFGKPARGLDPVNVTLTVFLRTDIYDAIAKFAREPDKVGVLSVRWQDAELLVRVLEERYTANRSRKSGTPAFDMWEEVFDPEVRGLPTRDYFLWRTLPRPRDFIYFANAALTTAINRKHSVITAADITTADTQYSRFAIEALLVESEAEGFDLEEALYEFAGMDSTMTAGQLAELLSGYENAQEIKDWLIRTSFLGIEVKPGQFIHVEGETDARRQLKVAERFAERSHSEVRFRVHPAFRAFLEVRDDDLHDEKIRDATFNDSAQGAEPLARSA
jgi:hypothetical protein